MTAHLFGRRPRPAQPAAGAAASRTARRQARRARLPLLALALLAVASCTSSGQPADDTPDQAEPAAPTPAFSAESPFNVPIPADPVLDDQSEQMSAALIEDGGTGYALLYDYGVPVYDVSADTPGVSVTCTAEGWGVCPLADQPVPIPADARPSSGSDAAMVVIDRSSGRVYDFWQAEQTSSGDWTASWGTWAPIGSSGIGGEAGGVGGGATAAGINLLAGLIRTTEIEAGAIQHALALVSDTSCPGEYRYPATKTDGHAESDICVPQGARVQLDPSIDVTAIPGITPAEVAVAQALQTYGGYLRDSSEVALGVAFEDPTDGTNPYPDAGLTWDYYDMPHIPWDSLRVLSHWDGS